MPARGCQSAMAYIFSGGAHCCTTSILATKCGNYEHAYSIELGDSVRQSIRYIKFRKNESRKISLYDWSFAYYNIDGTHSLCFACSPAFRRLLVFDENKLRPDAPREFKSYYANLLTQTQQNMIEAQGTSASDDSDMVALSITKAYYALMSGMTESQCRTMLYSDLPQAWQSVRSRVFTDIKKAVLTFDPIKILR